jgi:hypothetical protein
VCRKTRKERVFHLFNDVLLYGSVPLAGRVVNHGVMDLNLLRVDDVPDNEAKRLANAFQLVYPKKSFVVLADSPQVPASSFCFQMCGSVCARRCAVVKVHLHRLPPKSKVDWMLAITKAITEWKQVRKRLLFLQKKKKKKTIFCWSCLH